MMQVQLIRHATLRVSIGGHTFLIDPMFSAKEAMEPIQNASNTLRIPMVPLPFSANEILKDVEAVLVTHTHRDHWDDAATEAIPKAMPIICQPEDAAKFGVWGYTDVRPCSTELQFDGVTVARTAGQHGTGEIGRKMAPVSGFVLRTIGSPSIYIAGDTIYCPEVESALQKHRPDITVVNAGAAQFTSGGPITMNALDVAKVCGYATETSVIAVHMEAINHCFLRRDDLDRELKNYRLRERVAIPCDGEMVEFEERQESIA
ncbi:MAG: MBL fold metallo-hydrolase [Terriglobia bacterium]|jgi:L-ascorbate metabolism protein UlaG (beta-lactamase superfamily)|nr:MBL fold metallo-hydrolase [Terriglobia bacterium]